MEVTTGSTVPEEILVVDSDTASVVTMGCCAGTGPVQQSCSQIRQGQQPAHRSQGNDPCGRVSASCLQGRTGSFGGTNLSLPPGPRLARDVESCYCKGMAPVLFWNIIS